MAYEIPRGRLTAFAVMLLGIPSKIPPSAGRTYASHKASSYVYLRYKFATKNLIVLLRFFQQCLYPVVPIVHDFFESREVAQGVKVRVNTCPPEFLVTSLNSGFKPLKC